MSRGYRQTVDKEITVEEFIVRFCQKIEENTLEELVRCYRERVFELATSVLGPNVVGEVEKIAREAMQTARTYTSRGVR